MELFALGQHAYQQHNESLGFITCGGKFCVCDEVLYSQEEIYFYISRPTRCTYSYNESLLIIQCSTCFGLLSPKHVEH